MKKVLLSLALLGFVAAGSNAIAQEQNKKDKKEQSADQNQATQQDQTMSNTDAQKAPDATQQQADPNQQPQQAKPADSQEQAPAPGTTPSK